MISFQGPGHSYHDGALHPLAEQIAAVLVNALDRAGGVVGVGGATARAVKARPPAIYDLNASMYIFNTDFLRENKTGILWETTCMIYLMKDTAVLDIDSEEDFEMMQLIGGYLFKNVDGFKAVRDKIRDSDVYTTFN